MPEFSRVGTLAEVPEAEVRGYEIGGTPVGVAHLPDGVFAFRDECPEDGCRLSDGRLDEEGAVRCPCDGSTFDVRTGEPERGPAVDPVPVFPLRVAEGWVEVAVP